MMLTNKDTIVRWSAAKGIGRICGRLEMDQADDVLNALIEVCFTPIQSDTAWHGVTSPFYKNIRDALH
jgi:hypothetical protein